MSGALSIGWYGKLPCAGDFVHRRLSFTIIHALDRWLRHGLVELRALHPQGWQAAFQRAPVWNFALPGAAVDEGAALVGLVAPSRDRVGREFPLCAAVSLPARTSPAGLLAGAHGWLGDLGRAVRQAQRVPTTIDAFDAAVLAIALPDGTAEGSPDPGGADILEILGPTPDDVDTVPMALAQALPWPDLPTSFDPAGATAYWWTNTAGGGALRGFTSDAGLAPSLLLTLMQPLPGADRSLT